MITPTTMSWEDAEAATVDELAAAYQADGMTAEQATAYARALRHGSGPDLLVD